MANDGVFNIIPALGNLPLTNADNPIESDSNNAEQTTRQLKINAALLFAKNWNQSQAAQRRNGLTAQFPNNESTRSDTRSLILQKQNEQANNLLKQSWQDLISQALQHKDLGSFHQESAEFWGSVTKMSELHTIEKYVNGQLETRVTSRYGELLESLNRQGGAAHLENFLNSLPFGEREVFLARYQINQTFGANELFAGRGIAADINAQFPLKVFLSANGKNPQLSAVNMLLGIYGGDAACGKTAVLEQNILASNFQFLLNPKSPSLLGLSLALHQNINARLSLNDLAPEAFLPKINPEFVALPNQTKNKNVFGKSENNSTETAAAKHFAGEVLVVAALINGALKTAEKYRKNKYVSGGLPKRFDEDAFGCSFAAGATGAMMGATIGCVAPLAEKSVGEVLGFAASVVVGLTDAGLRSLGANTLVSLITNGIQNFLDVSGNSQKKLPSGAPDKFLNRAETFANDSRRDFYNHPLTVSG